MNSRERMAIAMSRGTPDRVPVMCQLAIGHYFLRAGIDPVEVWHDTQAFAQALVELQKRYGFDGILVNLPGRDPAWRDYVTRVEDDAGNRIVHWNTGQYTVVPPDDNPHIYSADGSRYFAKFSDMDPEELFYMDPHDISGLSYPYSWSFSGNPAPVGTESFFPPWQFDTLRQVVQLTHGTVSVHAEVFSPLSQLMEMLDYTNGLMCLVEDEGKVLAILERLADGAATLGRMQLRHGADALLISSAFAGAGFISRRHYEQFELPSLLRTIGGIRQEFPDARIYVHTCGAIADRLDLMERSGVDGIDTLDPPPLGTVDLEGALRILGKRVFIKGNLDGVNTLLLGSREDVYTAACQRLEIARPGGAYVLSTACSVPPATAPENILQLREAVEAHGYY